MVAAECQSLMMHEELEPQSGNHLPVTIWWEFKIRCGNLSRWSRDGLFISIILQKSESEV